MAWGSEERFRRGKKVWHLTDRKRYRVSLSRSILHYGEPDTDLTNQEVDLTPTTANGARLSGPNTTNAGFHFGFQSEPPREQQKDRGMFGFGGRAGQEFVNMAPVSVGYLNWRTNGFQSVLDNPVWRRPRVSIRPKTFGIGGTDPSLWSINVQSDVDCGNIWTTPGGGTIHYMIRLSGGQVEPVFTLNQEARSWIERSAPNVDSDAEATFGVVLKVDLNTIDRLEHRGRRLNRLGDSEDLDSELNLKDEFGRPIATIGDGQIFVPNRGGRVDIMKRLWFDGTNWLFFMGCNVAQMRQNLLRGDMVIDPPIAEESIAANSDDAEQGDSGGQGVMNLSGFSSSEYLGDYTFLYHSGWRFTTVPIGNGDTVNSATLEPTQSTGAGTNITAILYGDDSDNAGTFTTTASDITNRTRTTASTNLATADWPGNNLRASWNVASIVQEIVNRGGWASNNALAFVGITTSNQNTYVGFDDYVAGAANAADFNADVSAAGGGGGPLPYNRLNTVLYKNILGR